MTTSDVVISDMVIVATSENTTSSVMPSCGASKEPVQLKLKVDEHGLGLSREHLSSAIIFVNTCVFVASVQFMLYLSVFQAS